MNRCYISFLWFCWNQCLPFDSSSLTTYVCHVLIMIFITLPRCCLNSYHHFGSDHSKSHSRRTSYWSYWWLYEPSESTGSEPIFYRTRSFPFLYRLPPCRHTKSKRVALFILSRARTPTLLTHYLYCLSYETRFFNSTKNNFNCFKSQVLKILLFFIIHRTENGQLLKLPILS